MADEKIQKILLSDNTFASTLIILLADAFGSLEFLNWEPETVGLEVADRFGVTLTENNMDKIQALSTVLTTNLFYTDVDTFIHVCNSLGGEGADFETFDPAEIDEIAWTLTEVLLNDPQEKDSPVPFTPEIKEYIKLQATHEGFMRLPAMLENVSEALPNTYEGAADLGAEMLTVSMNRQADKVAEIENDVKKRMAELFNQIQNLPLHNADSESWQAYAGKPLQVKRRSMTAV
jgi:hypothetical protein